LREDCAGSEGRGDEERDRKTDQSGRGDWEKERYASALRLTFG
jgi:hypothetical protein